MKPWEDTPVLIYETEYGTTVFADPAVLLDPEAFEVTKRTESRELIDHAMGRREKARQLAHERLTRLAEGR